MNNRNGKKLNKAFVNSFFLCDILGDIYGIVFARKIGLETLL